MNYSFKSIIPDASVWKLIEGSPESMCFFSADWASYLGRMRRKLFVVEISSEGVARGYFVGVRSNLLFLRLVSAPSMGTGTYSQGLCMLDSYSQEERVNIYVKLVTWLINSKQADYVQVCDWRLRTNSKEWIDNWNNPWLDKEGVYYTRRDTFCLDTLRPLDELWANLNYKSCKYAINKARKQGLYVKSVDCEADIPAFVEQHHQHAQDVLKRKKNTGLPCQHKEYMLALCQSLFPNRVLMLEVKGKDEFGQEQSMASAIFTLDKGGSSYFTSGSFKQYMHYCPNEILLWEAIVLLHNRGAGDLIFGGVAHYKKKFNPDYAVVPVMVFSRWKMLLGMRSKIKVLYEKAIHWAVRLNPFRK